MLFRSREVRVEESQPVVNELLGVNVLLGDNVRLGANGLMRLGRWFYGVTDLFVQEIWRQRQG